MTRTEAEARARELREGFDSNCPEDHARLFESAIAAARLAAAAEEREACAKACFHVQAVNVEPKDAADQKEMNVQATQRVVNWMLGAPYAAAIRARGLRLDNNSSKPGKEPKHK